MRGATAVAAASTKTCLSRKWFSDSAFCSLRRYRHQRNLWTFSLSPISVSASVAKQRRSWRSCRAQLHGSAAGNTRFGQAVPSTHPHLLRPGEITPHITDREYKKRRGKLLESLPEGSVCVIPSASQVYMSHDIPFPFRQNSDFFYLSGFLEPDAALVFDKTGGQGTFHMLVQPKCANKERWDGPRSGSDAAVSHFGADCSAATDDLPALLSPLLSHATCFYYQSKVNRRIDVLVEQATKNTVHTSNVTPQHHIHTLRAIKSASEQRLLQRAADVVACALRRGMEETVHGMSEAELAARLHGSCLLEGAQRMSFPPVVAGGRSALILHYVANDSLLQDGDLVLVDAGAEVDGYASDVTRTWPVSPDFSPAQRRVYEAVLDVQERTIEMAAGAQESCPHRRPSLADLDAAATAGICEHLLDMGILSGRDVESVLAVGDCHRFYPHSIGHHLGLDTHDVDTIAHTRPLQPGNVITIEPGLYIPFDESIPPEYRGIGVRIEDDVLIEEGGVTVLSHGVPKAVDEVLALRRRSFQAGTG